MNGRRSQIYTIPNMLSLLRLALIPVYCTVYLRAQTHTDHFIAATILAVSCLTDLIDGQIARRFQMISTLGKILDPLADKLTQLALLVCLSTKYPILLMVLVLLLLKELSQTAVAILFFRRGKALPGAIPAGKICTAALFVSFITLVLIPELNHKNICIIAFTDAFFLIFAFISYAFAFLGPNPKVQDFEA